MNIKRFLSFAGSAMIALFGVSLADWAAAEESGGRHHIAGKIVDEKGRPVADAVVALGPMPSMFDRERSDYARSDQSGAFDLLVPYPGNATVSCWHPGYVALAQSASTDEVSTITLRSGEVLEGLVDCAEDLKASIVVSVFFPDTGYQDYARADRDGAFRFGNLPVGPCEVEARARDGSGTKRVMVRDTATIRSGENTIINLVPATGSVALSGTVTDDAHSPIAAQLTIYIGTGGGKHVESIRSDLSGRFAFPALPPGAAQLVISASDRATVMQAMKLEGDIALEPVELGEAQSLRCSLLNAPEGTVAAQLVLLPGKSDRPGALLSDVRALLDLPAAWSGVVRGKTTELKVLAPGPYTLLAYPLASATAEYSTFEVAESLRLMPVYMDSFTVREGGAGVVVAAAFPQDGRAAYIAAQQPLHPVIGSWVYRYKGSVWTRTFTQDGRCILTEGPVTGWVNPYVILGERRVAVIIDGTKRIHTLNKDGTLDVEGQFTASRIQ